MKKEEIIASEYANKLIAYDGIINKATALINKYYGVIEEKEREKEVLLKDKQELKQVFELAGKKKGKKSFLKNKKGKKAKAKKRIVGYSELEEKRDKFHKRCSNCIMAYFIIGNLILMVLALTPFYSSCFPLIYVGTFAIANALAYKKSSSYREQLNLMKAITALEETEVELDNAIAKLGRQIDNLERVNQITRKKADIVREALNQIEEQISLEEQPSFGLQTPQVIVPKQVVASQQTSNSQPKIGKERKISL